MSTVPGTQQEEIAARARGLRLLLFDVDGVLTDGRILLHADGTESKQYHIRDGTGLVLARRSGLLTGLLSARSSAATLARARQLAIPIVRQGATNKLTVYEEILAEHGLADHEVAFMGDDVQDLPVLMRVGLSCAPADAVPEVRGRVRWISAYGGGAGAVRELIERVLRARGSWDALVGAYLPDQAQPESDVRQSARPEPEQPEPEQPEPEQPESEQPESEQPESERPQAEWRDPERPQSDRPQSDRRQSDRRQSNRPEGVR
jgi:3-deoxy-D-manno-octulosonate 8-phosphate phosphatase (KDO 8-P phosphatase)